MPTPRKNEKKQHYISRCIKYRREKENKDEKMEKTQAICYSMWRDAKNKKKKG